MPETIGAVFLGCTHPHIFYRLALLKAAPDVTILGCYDPDSALAEEFKAHHGLRVFDTPEALLDQPGVNFAIIEGWDVDNPRYVALAAERRLGILLEKPGAPNLPAMRALVDAVRGQPLPFQMAYQLRYSPVMPHLRRILASGVLGPITLVRCHAAAPVGAGREPWQSVPGDLGGTVFTDGCHMIDLIVHLFGIPSTVTGTLLKLPAGEPVLAHGYKATTFAGRGETVTMPVGGLMYEDAGAAVLRYDDKVITFDITAWEAQPWVENWRIEVYGANGTLLAGVQPPWYRLYIRNPTGDYQHGWHTWEGSHLPAGAAPGAVNVNYTDEMAYMLERVRAWDTDNEARLIEAEAVVTVLDGIFRSHEEGRAIPIETRSAGANGGD